MPSQDAKLARHKPPPCWKPDRAAKAAELFSFSSMSRSEAGVTALAQHLG